MRRQGSGSRWQAAAIAATLAASGCASCLHPVAPPSSDAAAQCAAMPQACRNHVYIFLIDGPDPLDLANLGGVRQTLISLGYIKTYCGECWHTGYFKDEMRRIHREDESARFVVMGFSLGANAARDVVDGVKADGVWIDLLVYCGGVGLPNDLKSRPDNAGRIVSILGQGADRAGPALDGADNVQFSDVHHFGSPTHPYTIEMLARELTAVASLAPVIDLRPAEAVGPEQAPPSVDARADLPRDDWDFLKTAPRAPKSDVSPHG
jgi:hypothetical protein